MQLHHYISDSDETLILQAGQSIEVFLKLVVRNAVATATRNLSEDGK